ncbi:MAG TPA: tetratricopeptide repeat protein, partial [Bacteroidales bacterium]
MKYRILLLFFSTVFLFSCGSFSNKQDKPAAGTNALDSLEILTKLIVKDSSNFQYFEKRAYYYLQRGNIDPAFRDLSYALELQPNEPSLYLMLSDIYFLLGKTENSISALKKAYQLEPESEKAFLKLSERYLMLQNYENALAYAERAISMNLENSDGYYYKGIVKMETGDTLAALNNLKIACNLDTLNYKAFMQVGGLLSVLNDTNAEGYYIGALKAKPGDESALFLLALLYQNQLKFEKALEAYQVINEFYPDNQRAFFNLGYIYLVELNEPEKAADAFRQAIVIYPKYLEAIYNLGRTYEELGQYDLAREQYRKSLDLLPNYPLAVKGLNRLDD